MLSGMVMPALPLFQPYPYPVEPFQMFPSSLSPSFPPNLRYPFVPPPLFSPFNLPLPANLQGFPSQLYPPSMLHQNTYSNQISSHPPNNQVKSSDCSSKNSSLPRDLKPRERSSSQHYDRHESYSREQSYKGSNGRRSPEYSSKRESRKRSRSMARMDDIYDAKIKYMRCTPLEPYYKQASVVDSNELGKTINIVEASDNLISLRNKFNEEVLERAIRIRAEKPSFSYPKKSLNLKCLRLHGEK